MSLEKEYKIYNRPFPVLSHLLAWTCEGLRHRLLAPTARYSFLGNLANNIGRLHADCPANPEKRVDGGAFLVMFDGVDVLTGDSSAQSDLLLR